MFNEGRASKARVEGTVLEQSSRDSARGFNNA